MGDILSVYGPPFAVGALSVALVFVLGLWLVSLAIRDSSIVDIGWGLGCAALAWIYWTMAKGAEPRATLTLALATLWGARLGAYIGTRNWGAEDRRYARLRQHVTDQGKNYALYSLRMVFAYQGAAMLIVTLPFLVAIVSPAPKGLGLLGWIATAVILAGIVVETIADRQMAAFRAGPRQPGEVMDKGLWRYSRHPNYFGEMLAQWGFFLMACDVGPIGLATFVGPLLLSYFIIGPLGAALLERRLLKKNPGYAAYVERTSAFVPWPPKSS